MKYEPPSGSAVSVPPASFARICCVRSAIRAARSVGSASASSNEFVCIDCAPPADRRQRLHRDAHDVVLRLLRGQRRAARLRVEAERLRLRVRRAEAVAHDLRPQPPRRAELRHLLEEVVVRVEEEREPRAELVGREARVDGGLAVGDPVRERERELLHRGRARLADVVAGDRDRVPAAAAARRSTRTGRSSAASTAAAGRCSSRARCTP